MACGFQRATWVCDSDSQAHMLAQSDELDTRRKPLVEALTVLNDRERRIFEARRLAEKYPIGFLTRL
jgi:RNA polymerase sigma-32 factor